MSRSIDYSGGTANFDKDTGIHYGIICIHNLNEWAWEDFETDYGDPTCPKYGNPVIEWDGEKHDDYESSPAADICLCNH